MRLPKNPENWHPEHAEKAIAEALRLFKIYENKIDFSWPQEKQDKVYLPYRIARQTAVEVATYVRWCVGEANALP